MNETAYKGFRLDEMEYQYNPRVSVPEYPELARRLKLHGIARVEVTVAPDGKVKEVKEIGGNPVLLQALVRAVNKWRYEPAANSSTLEVKYEFTGE